PIPGSRWAIPVLMIGNNPVSTTFRASIPAGLPVKFMVGSGESGVAAQTDVPHCGRSGNHILGAAADPTDDGGRSGHGESAKTRGLSDCAVTEVAGGILH